MGCSPSSLAAARKDRIAPHGGLRPAPSAAAPSAAPSAPAIAGQPSAVPVDEKELLRSFVRALKDGDLVRTIELLDTGAPLEHRGMWDNTPLLVACHYAHAEVQPAHRIIVYLLWPLP